MNLLKRIWNYLIKPKPLFLALFYILFVILLALTLTLVCVSKTQTVIHYILYGLSAISLTYFVYTIVIFAPTFKQDIIRLLRKFKFTSTLLDNYGYRTMMFSIVGFVLNVAYVVFIGILAIVTHSAWYIAITAYYLILTLMKGNIFYSKKKYNTELKKARAYRFCGIMFILLMLAFSGVIVLIYTSNMYFEYAGIMIYAVAGYTFYKLTLAIINIFKARHQNDLYIQSLRNINLVSAMISIIVLQVAMFQAFSPQHNTSVFNGLTGGAISLLIVLLGAFMIIKSNKKIKYINETNLNYNKEEDYE